MGAELSEMGKRHGRFIDQLQVLLKNLAMQRSIRSVIIALENYEGSFSWTGVTGETDSDGSQVQEDTPFFIASIDKLLNATIVMRMSEDGLLDLDATISTYLSPTLTRKLHCLGGIDYSEQITVRHLLGHTSGLPDWLEDRPKNGRSMFERIIEEGDVAIGIEEIATIVREQLTPHFSPQDHTKKRQKIRYSDTNYMLLIAIIEAVMKQPLHQVHEHFLYRPLDMRHTYFIGRSDPLDPTLKPTMLRSKGKPLHIPKLLRSVWGIYSTASDTLTFLKRFVRGEVFQYPETLASMQERWNRFGFPLDRAAFRSPSWPIEYGLGIMRFGLPRILTPIHPMPRVLGHTGSTGCWLFYCPQLDMLLSGSVDEVTGGAVPYRVVPGILKILRSEPHI